MVATSGTSNGHRWTLAGCLQVMFHEADTRDPTRSHAADGTIGDSAHAARPSDHNPALDPTDNCWYVCAGDIDDDNDQPLPGVDLLCAHLVASKDPRVKYLIRNGTIWKAYENRGLPAWTPQVYTGANAHRHHLHISVWNTATARNDLRPWWPEEDDDMALSDEDILKVAEAVTIALKPQLDAVYDKIVPTETVRADIRLTRDIATKVGVTTSPP